MGTILMKKRTKFYDGTPLLDKGALFNLCLGGKNLGKSGFWKKYCIEKAYFEGLQFFLMFRFESDRRTNAAVENYFTDDFLIDYIKDMTDGAFECVRARAGKLYLGNHTGKNQFGFQIGSWGFLNKEESYNSSVFENCFNILLEEFISRKGYLADEPHIFEIAVNTILRDRAYDSRSRVILVGNLISKVNPYVSYWSLFSVLRQKKDTIEMFERVTEYSDGSEFKLKIAVQICPDLEIGGIAIGKKAKQEEQGEFETDEVPTISNWQDYEEITRFVFVWDGFYFLCRALTKDFDSVFLYVERKTTRIKPDTRVIGKLNVDDVSIVMSLYYTKGFTPLVEAERKIFGLIQQGKVVFSDKSTGTDFWICIDSLE